MYKYDTLIEYKKLLDEGILTQEEFNEKKAEILSSPPEPVIKEAAATEDTGDIVWAIIGFILPLVGLILYLVWQPSRPKDAQKAGKGALIGVIVGVISYVFIMALGSVMYWF